MRRQLPALVRSAAVAAFTWSTLCAQTSTAPAPVPIGTPPPSTVAGTVVYTKPSMANVFGAANPTLTFVGAASNGLIYRQQSTGKYALRAGLGLTYQSNGHWYPTQLQIARADDGSGWLVAGTSIQAKLNGAGNPDESLELVYDSDKFKLQTPKLAYSGQAAFSFQENGTQWTLHVLEHQISIQTTVATRLGKSGGVHTFGFIAPTSAALNVDSSGHFHAGENFTVTRALVIGADRKSYGICSPWSTDTQNISFTCDDSDLPQEAFPYVIDPNFQTGMSGNNFGMWWDQQQSGSGQQMSGPNPTLSAYFNISVPGGSGAFQSASFDDSQFSFSWQPTSGNPSCSYNPGADETVYYPYAYYTLKSVSMTWYADGSLYACTGSYSGNIYVTVWYVAESVTTPNNPNGPGGFPATSYTYTTGGSTDSYGGAVQYKFNWGDGTNSGWLPQGTTSASHSWASAGSYCVTATAQSVSTQVQSGTSGCLLVTLTWPTTTITSSPSGLNITVDGTTYAAPRTFNWPVGGQHTVSVPTPQSAGTGRQYVFYSWSDAGALTHTISAPSIAQTFTATLAMQYQLTLTVGSAGGGTISASPSGGWYTAGTGVAVSATANSGYTFSGFSGSLGGTITPQNLTMNGPATVSATFTAQPAGFLFGRAIIVPATQVPNTNQINFPVMVSLADSTLKTVANGGHVNNPSGYDICFYADSAGTTPLSWEVESYNGAAGTLIAWVKIPTLSHTTNTVFYMFYGNSAITLFQSVASAAWDGTFVGVWHLPDGTTLSAKDSTANGFNGSITGATAVGGEIGGGARFNGSNAMISAGLSSTLSPASITMSGWVKPTSLPASGGVVNLIDKRDDTGGSAGYALELYNNAGTQQIVAYTAGNSGASANYTLPTASWSYLTVTQGSGTCSIYVNGARVANASANAVTNYYGYLLFGARSGSAYFNGSLDELRISSTARSADWIATEYNNQGSPATFYSVGAEASPAVAAGTFSISLSPASATANPGGGATYTVTVNGYNGFSGTVTFSTAGLPANSTSQFSPTTVTGSGSATMTVYATASSSFTVTATTGTSSSTQSAAITVQSSPYTFYQTDSLTSINPSNWTSVGTVTTSSGGLTAGPYYNQPGGVVISNITAPSGNDYDEQATVTSCGWGTISLYARSNSTATTAYVLRLSTAVPAALTLYKAVNNVWTTLSSWAMNCTTGMALRMAVRGSNIIVWEGAYVNTFTDTAIPAGQPGVGVGLGSTNYIVSVSNVQFGPVDSTRPPAPDQGALYYTSAPYWVDLQWPAGTDNPGGVGLAGYSVYRDNVLLGQTPIPQWRDDTVLPSTTHTYSVWAYDQHGNVSLAPATISGVNTQPPTQPDEQRAGLHSSGAYWGGAGEQIDMLSGNLNFTMPLIKPIARSGWSVQFSLSYNSQMWRKDNGGHAVWLLGRDVGYGLGWKLLAGSIRPVWFNSVIQFYIYTDSTGAEYRLDQNVNGMWSSLQGTYAVYDTTVNPAVLRFPDGSFWQMGVESSGAEQDAGTWYPSLMQDSNANQIQITYGPAIGWGGTNSSARITAIADARGNGSNTYTFDYTYSPAGLPHLTGIHGPAGTQENYSVVAYSLPIRDPFAGASYGNMYVLNQITLTGTSTNNYFTYDNSGELTKFTTPLGGSLGWSYGPWTYSGTNRTYQQVTGRTLQASYGATTYNWGVSYGNDTNGLHGTASIQDLGANTAKVWTFNTSTTAFAGNTPYPDKLLGSLTAYQEGSPASNPTAFTLQKSFTPMQSSGGQPYYSVVTTTFGGASPAQTTTVQTLDTHGNLTQSQVFDFGSAYPGTPSRTYNFQYLTGANYPYIFNRQIAATVTPNSVNPNGNTITLVTRSYDDSPAPGCPGIQQGLSTSQAQGLIGTLSGPAATYRGNLTQATGVNSTDVTCYAYDTTGIAVQTVNPSGVSVAVQTQAGSNFSLPGVVTPNGLASMATTIGYTSSFAVASVTTGDGNSSSTAYDNAGRPTDSWNPAGAHTQYTYVYYSDPGNGTSVNTQTATFVNPPSGAPQRWKVTTVDGFGRAIQVDSGSGAVSTANTVSRVLTQYAPCACSPLLKLWRTSNPFNPNTDTPVWTTYAYDSSGRTISVTAPDNHSASTYTYSGNNTTVTDPAGKWKMQTKDAFGNLTVVTEPNPAGGANLTTSYTYSLLNQLLQVAMPRGTTTQYRTFSYTRGGSLTTDLQSASNPENGTVSYQYDAGHRVTCRTDAKGQVTQYQYSALGQLTGVSHTGPCGNFVADNTTGVNYTYDVYGRTSQVQFFATDLNFPRTFTYGYAYDAYGHVATQTMGWNMYSTGGVNNQVNESYSMSYQWDNEGKMTSYTDVSGVEYDYTYDGMGRATNLTGAGQQVVSATYGPANQLATLGSETRQYNSLLQLTGIVWGARSMTYNYPTDNNGRIASSVDSALGKTQTVNYTYDSLNRLTGAQAVGGWGESYSYDGFGNLTGITPTGQGGETWSGMADQATNRLVGVNYDANGNQIGDQVYTNFKWDPENRMVQQLSPAGGSWYGGTGYTYDPGGRRVMKNVNADPQGTNTGTGYGAGTWEFYFYGLNGRKMATIGCTYNTGYLELCQVSGENVYFAGQMIVDNGGPVVTDRLGSVRGDGSQYSPNYQYYPYGAEQAPAGSGMTKFATYFRDAIGQDYAEQRYYNAGMGRFWSVDPGGIETADPNNPATWNRYGYAGGDPVNYYDPTGLNLMAIPSDNGQILLPGGGSGGVASYIAGILSDGSEGFQSSGGVLVSGGTGSQENSGGGQPSCEDKETTWLASFLQRRDSPLAAYASEIVSQSDAAGVDDRFIVALAGVESTYGKATTSVWGKYNAWSDSLHCAVLQGDCQAVNPFSNLSDALSAAIANITGSLYFGAASPLTTTDQIYATYCGSGCNAALLNDLYTKELGGGTIKDNPKEVNFSRCPKK